MKIYKHIIKGVLCMPCNNYDCDPMQGMCLGYSYVPIQAIGETYCAEKALKRGTVFPELDLPLGVYGNNFCKKNCAVSTEKGDKCER